MAKTKEQISADAKRKRLWTLYRITPEEQDHVEEFMRMNPTAYDHQLSILLEKGGAKEGRVYTDHRHSDGLVRGRLAYLINKGLGVIEGTYKENTPSILRALADYLERPPATEVLGPRYGMIGLAKINKKKKVYGSATGPIKESKGRGVQRKSKQTPVMD